jgi:hypothetical protein
VSTTNKNRSMPTSLFDIKSLPIADLKAIKDLALGNIEVSDDSKTINYWRNVHQICISEIELRVELIFGKVNENEAVDNVLHEIFQ